MLSPYRAKWTPPGRGDVVDVIVTSVLVVDNRRASSELGERDNRVIYTAIRQDNGAHVEAESWHLTCSEPGYLAAPEPDPDEHEHDWNPIASPHLEGSRVVGMVRTCRFPGCDKVLSVPKGPLG